MKIAENRPAIHILHLNKSDNGTELRIILFSSNLPFYGLANLDLGRFKRSDHPLGPQLTVTLGAPQDPIWNQVVDLLSAPIKDVTNNNIWAAVQVLFTEFRVIRKNFSPAEFSVYAQLMSNSTIGNFNSGTLKLDDTSASFIIEIASRSKEFNLCLLNETQISDPATFITQLYSLPIISVFLVDSSSSFFGLPRSFWEKFLNEKLVNGSFEYVKIVGDIRLQFIKAPIIIPDDNEIYHLMWKKA
ncbi:hypothetical protein PMAYCL1PPCAC_27469, partial [Pristionchus mayeri]